MVSVSAMRRLLLLVVAVVALSHIATTAAVRCGAPYKTLSSDCRGLPGVDDRTVCVVLDQTTAQSCNVLAYNIAYDATQARVHIRFPVEQASPTKRAMRSARALQDDFAQLFRELAQESSAGSAVGDSRPPPDDPTTTMPPTTPGRPGRPPSPIIVDFPDTPAPPVTVTPSPTFVNFPSTPSPTTPEPTTAMAPTGPSRPGRPPTPIIVDFPETPAPTAPSTSPSPTFVNFPTTPSPTSAGTTTPTTPAGPNRPGRPPTPIIVDFPPTPTPTVPFTPSPTFVNFPSTPSPTPADTVTPPVPTAPNRPPGPPIPIIVDLPSTPTPTGPSPPSPTLVNFPTTPSRTPPSSPDPPSGGTGTGPNASTSPTSWIPPREPPTTQPPSPADTTNRPPNNGDNSTLPPASEKSDFIESIGQLRLPKSLTELRIIGGTNEVGTRGTAVKVNISPELLYASQSVTSLVISNCVVGEQFATNSILSGLPKGITDLSLRNTLMRTEPNDLSALQNLQRLKLEQNYLTSFSKRVLLPKLTLLSLSENDIKEFDADLPVVESLYLNKNNFNSIPAAVYSMNKLRELYLSGNPIVAIVISDTQHAFLSNIRVTIDKPPMEPPQPVVYVLAPDSGSLPADVTSTILNSKNIDFKNVVALPVGSTKSVGGFPVWTLPDGVHEVFVAQQEAISKSNVVIDGKTAQTYDDMVAGMAAKAYKTSSGSSSGNSSRPHFGDRENVASSDAQSNAASDALNPHLIKQSNADSNGHKTLTITLVAAVAIAALVATVFFVSRRRKRANSSAVSIQATLLTPQEPSLPSSVDPIRGPKGIYSTSLGSNESLMGMEDAAVRRAFSSRRVRLGDLDDVRPINSTSTDVTWLVKMRGNRLVASKRLIQSTANPMRFTEFVNEIVIASDLDHPSITRFIGVAWTDETDLQALFEYMPNGDLETYLHKTEPSSLLWSPTKLKLAIDIVEALVYTHSFNPPLLHRDLRSKNVFLDQDMNPKLSNFGFARYASEQNTMTSDGVGSGRWLAPEVLRGSVDYATASDVYAFGVLLSELDTHKVPYDDVRDFNGNATVDTELLERVARGELRPTFSAECPREIVELAIRCLSQDPTNRPSAIQVAYELRVLGRRWHL